jgi:hypothetical protein
MNEESHNPWTDPELEARIVALVLGEASDFERAELHRLMEEWPDLAAFKETIQHMHGLLQHAATEVPVQEDDDWKLSGEKRKAVLAAIGGELEGQSAVQVVTRSRLEEQRAMRRGRYWNLAKIAAAVCVAGLLGVLTIPGLFEGATSDRSALRRQLGLAQHHYHNAYTTGGRGIQRPVEGEEVPPQITMYSFDGELSVDVDNAKGVTGAVPTGEAGVVLERQDKRGRPVAQQSPAPNPDGDRLSFPEFETELGDRRASVAAVTAGKKVSVPDEGQVLLGGIRRLESKPRAFGASGESAGSSTGGSDRDVESRSRERWQEAADSPGPTSGDSPVVSKGGASTGGLPALGLGSQGLEGRGSLQEQGSSRAKRRLVENIELAVPHDPHDSLAAGEVLERDMTDSGTVVDSSGNGQADDRKEGAGMASSSEKAAEKEAVAWRKASELANAPAGPTRNPQSAREDRESKDLTRTEELGEQSLEELADLSDGDKNLDGIEKRLEDTYHKNRARFEYFSKSERGGQDELLRQRDQLAASGQAHWGSYTPKLLLGESRSMTTWERRAPVPSALIEKSAQEEAFSTFSLHVSDVSFKLAWAALANGQWPEAAKVRIEEFVNAFDYGDPLPTQSEMVSCQLEQSTHPFLQQRNLLRISLRTAAAGRSDTTPLRLTFVLDNSGSMERSDRQETIRRAFSLLIQQLKPIDQVTLISFARQPRLLADKVSGAQSQELLELIARLPSQGGTNIEAALQLAFEKAREQQVDGAQNRIILLTDGAVNLGDADPESLSQMITTIRHAGIAFDAAGICAEGLNDEVLEALTRKGDGRYYLLDSLEAAHDGFARQIAGALRPSAKNVKVQVEFNPQRVGRYRLLGFDKHRLSKEDFRDDSVDAAELAAAEAGVAIYQFEAKHDGEGDVGSVSVRFRDLSTGQMVEKRWPIPYEASAPRLHQAAPSIRIAASAALFAARLRGEPLGETVDLKTLSDLVAGLPDQDRNTARVQQLHQMIQQARQATGE